MRILVVFLFSLINVIVAVSQQQWVNPSPDKIIWYSKPASFWEEAVPLGNGFLGAMVYGDPVNEHVQLNESTLYSGEPDVTFTGFNVRKDYKEIVGLLDEKKYAEAQSKVISDWMGRNHQCYQPLGDLWIKLSHTEPIKNYRRTLNINEATASVYYETDNTIFQRDYFASYPDNIIVIKLSAQGAGKINATIKLTTPHLPGLTYLKTVPGATTMFSQAPGFVLRRTLEQVEKNHEQYKYPEIFKSNGERLPFAKQVLYGDEVENMGMYFAASVKPVSTDGEIEMGEDSIRIKNATTVTLVYTAATSFNGYENSPSRAGVDPIRLIKERFENIKGKNFEALYQAHFKDYSSLFNNVSIHVAKNTPQSNVPTDERIKLFSNKQDLSLVNLFYQFNRYLMIAGSRPGGQPLNLQGMWNNKIIPPWNGAYTININLEMNYWPAETTNLESCQEPLFRAIKELAQNGVSTAHNVFGMDGWVANHNMDIWRHTEQIDICPCSFWPMAAGWLVSHMWEHYLYSGDTAFLRNTVYPLLKGACVFYDQWLVKNNDGYWLTPVGHSPEAAFKYGQNETSTLSPGPTMDIAIIRESFERLVYAANMLKVADDTVQHIAQKLSNLLPYQIGKYGQLQEWSVDFEEAEKDHRHVSHLYGSYPGNQINPWDNKELATAVQTSLDRRGDKATGWAKAWRINLLARLLNATKAYKQLENLFVLVDNSNLRTAEGGLFTNMFNAHPPFQIDGNFGTLAGITEMLMQSYAGAIVLLPALPSQWPDGSISGIKARSGFLVDMKWKDGKVSSVKLTSLLGGNCRLRVANKIKRSNMPYIQAKGANPNPLIAYDTPGKFEGASNIKTNNTPSAFDFVYDIPTKKGDIIEIEF